MVRCGGTTVAFVVVVAQVTAKREEEKEEEGQGQRGVTYKTLRCIPDPTP